MRKQKPESVQPQRHRRQPTLAELIAQILKEYWLSPAELQGKKVPRARPAE